MISVCSRLVCLGDLLFLLLVCRASFVRVFMMTASVGLKCVCFILVSVCGRVNVCSVMMLYFLLLLLLLLLMCLLISAGVMFLRLLSW